MQLVEAPFRELRHDFVALRDPVLAQLRVVAVAVVHRHEHHRHGRLRVCAFHPSPLRRVRHARDVLQELPERWVGHRLFPACLQKPQPPAQHEHVVAGALHPLLKHAPDLILLLPLALHHVEVLRPATITHRQLGVRTHGIQGPAPRRHAVCVQHADHLLEQLADDAVPGKHDARPPPRD